MIKYEKKIKYLYVKGLKSQLDKLYKALQSYKLGKINIKELEKYYFSN